MNEKSSTERSSGSKLIFACSGVADTGEIADRAARKLTQRGDGSMFCLAGIGGNVPGIIHKTESASKILAIDGCKLDCVKKCLELAGFHEFEHLRITDLGMVKGKTPVNDENVEKVVQNGAALLS